MGTIEDIKLMQQQGKSEFEIRTTLQQKGTNEREINEGLAQAKIKEAVSSQGEQAQIIQGQAVQGQGGIQGAQMVQQAQDQGGIQGSQTGQIQVIQGGQAQTPTPGQPGLQQGGGQNPAVSQAAPGYEGMQPSMLVQDQQQPQASIQPGQTAGQEEFYQVGQSVEPDQQMTQDYGSYQAAQSNVGGYEAYQPYQEAMSSDVMTEISEQVVSEKLAAIRDELEEAINFKAVGEARMASLDERLGRIEQIMDRLQLSILQRMGDYVSDVKNVKKELVETQKSFKKIVGMKKTPIKKGKREVP